MKKKLKRLLLVIFITCIALAYVFNFDQYLTLESIKANRLSLKALVDRHYTTSVFAYIAFYIALVAFSLPTGGMLTLIGGFLFGFLPATAYVIIGATTGASLSFLLTRYLIGDVIAKKYPRYTAKVSREVERYGYSYMLTLRLMAIVPFFLVNIAAATTTLSFVTFVWTTAIGIIPATMVIAFAGQQLGTINSLSDIFSRNLILAFILLALLALVPMLFQRFKRKSL